MTGKSVELSRVDLDPKSILWLTVALGVLVLAWGVANWGATKLKGLTQKGGATDEFL